MSAEVTNVAASVRARLRNVMEATGEDFQRLLERYAIERFLYRLSVSELRDSFVLKGAMLMTAWPGVAARATRDLDLLGFGDSAPTSVADRLRRVLQTEVPPDGLVFQGDDVRAAPIREAAEYGGVRVRFSALLGKARIPVQVDVGFGDAITPGPVEIEFPTLLGGAAPRIRAYPVETVIAEKLEAVVRLGETNTRYKDFYDLWLLAATFDLDGPALVSAVSATFRRRGTALATALPIGLQPAFFERGHERGEWRAFLTRTEISTAPADFRSVGEALRGFLGPLLTAMWGGPPLEGTWRSGAWP